jgi:hypothetical protein
MSTMSKLSILTAIAAAAVLAGCASQPTAITAGKHLVYRDTAGKPMRQFDYPSDDLCRRVEALAGNSARCQSVSASDNLQARATLRYMPPGVMVQGHYADMNRCQQDTGSLPPGVELVDACKAK